MSTEKCRNRLAAAAAVALSAAVLAGGCFTVSQSEFPQVEMSKAPAGEPVRVAISGFEAIVTTYTPVYGYATVWHSGPGYYRHGRFYRGADYPETVSTTTYIPQSELTKAYAEMAQDGLEAAGFVVASDRAKYIVDVKFSGPAVADGDKALEVAGMVFSLLTTDFTRETWQARLKVTDAASGRVVLMQNYEQEYHATAVGLIPLFGPLAAETVGDGYIRNWCLSALTQRTVADATAFIAGAGDGKEKTE